ncbi:MAG: MBG domain-containing protein [Burkholderiales bacterium]
MRTKRILSILLVVAMLVTLLPTTALADGGNANVHDHENHIYAVVGIHVVIEAGNNGKVYSPDWQVGVTLWKNVTWTFEAKPDPGYRFVKWTYNGNGVSGAFTTPADDPKLSVTFTKDGYWSGFSWKSHVYKAQAVFEALPVYNLTVNTTGGGSVSKSPDKSSYYEGDTVKLTANPDGGYKFKQWSGDASGTSNTIEVTMNSHKNITAEFELLPTYKLETNVSPAGSGSVSKDPDVASYWEGRSVKLTANAASGYRFGSWSGDVTGTENPKTISMNGNKSVTANFIKTYTVTLNVEGPGKLDNPNRVAGTRDENATLNLNDADPDANAFCKFVGWKDSSGQFLSSPNITVTGDCTYTAVFGEINRLNLAAGPNGYLANPGLAQHYGEGTQINLNDALPTGDKGYTLDCWKEYGWMWMGTGTVVPLVDGKPIITIGESNYFKAFFKEANYKIKYNLDGGTVSGNRDSYTYWTDSFKLNNPTKTGYTFLGWSGTDIPAGTYSKEVWINKYSTGDREYTANWTPNSYTVEYYANGGTGTMASSTHTYDVEQALNENKFTKDGCTFAGWAESPDGPVKYGDKQVVKNLSTGATVKLYAKWNVSGVTVTGYDDVYDGAYHGVTVSGAAGATVLYSVDDETNYTSTDPLFKDVTPADGRKVYIKVERAGAAPFVTSAVVKITKKALTITANDETVTYGDSIPAYSVTYKGFAGSEDKSVLGGKLTIYCSYNQGSPVSGSPYSIIPSGCTSNNYDINYVNGKLTVNKKVLTITANDEMVTYGDAAPAYSVTYNGFVGSEDESVLGGALIIDCSYAAGSPVSGSPYSIIPSGYTSDNYDINYVNGNLTVNKKLLTIAANDEMVTYGDAAPAYSVTYNGFVGSEDESVLGGALNIDCSYAAGSPVSGTPYKIIPSGYTSDNYDINYVNGNLMVNPKELKVTADNKTIIYGGLSPMYTATFDGFITGEDEALLGGTLEFSSPYTVGSNAGTYPIMPYGLTSTNYDIKFVGGVLTVNKAALTVTAEDKAVTYLDAPPAYTVKYTGFVAGDTEADLGGTLVFSCSYAAGSAVGTYKITPSGLTSDNYNITFVDGTLTVNTLMLTVTFQDYDGTVLGTSTVPYGTAATPPANPTREGYTFTGWSASFNNVTSALTVTAQYAINTYTVRFFAADGVTEISSQTVNFDGAAALPTAPRRTGYAFDEWVLTGDNPAYPDSLTHVKENINAVASYIRNGYTVTFVDYDGSVIGTDGVLYGQNAVAPVPPTREGYTFIGWDREFNPVTGNVTVTAQYEINRYTVRFVDYDGTVIDTQTVDYNTAATAPPDPTRDGYTFTGWDTSFDAVTSDLTVTAQYEPLAPVPSEPVPEADNTIPDEPVPATGGNAFAWWWIAVIVLGAGLLFFLIFFVWKRRRKEEGQQ